MNNSHIRQACTLAIVGLGSAAVLLAGCQDATKAPASGETLENLEVASAATPVTGAQLWAQNCVHCHNAHPTTAYSDAGWSVVMSHMRQQAHLTGEQSRKILEFLQASN